METFLEVLKYTLPGLVVFATAYFLLKLYLDDKQREYAAQYKGEALKLTLPLRLQAYERLVLFCERASIPNLLMRLRMSGMSVDDLRTAMLLAVRQEFDHNASQQVYVSATLWRIITLARDETLLAITRAAENLDEKNSADEYVDALLKAYTELDGPSPLQRAQIAIHTEAEGLF